MPARRLLLRVVVVALCLTAAIAIIVLLSGSFDDTSWRILGTTTAISVFALVSVPAGVLLERGRARLLAQASGVFTLVGFLLTLGAIWNSADVPSWLWRTYGVILTLDAALAQAAAVESRRRDSDTDTIDRLALASMATASLLAAMGIAAILATIDDGGFYRILGAIAVLDVLLVVLAAVLRRGSGPIDRAHKVRVDGRLVELPGRDFAAAVATAIRQAEREGREVRRIERG